MIFRSCMLAAVSLVGLATAAVRAASPCADSLATLIANTDPSDNFGARAADLLKFYKEGPRTKRFRQVEMPGPEFLTLQLDNPEIRKISPWIKTRAEGVEAMSFPGASVPRQFYSETLEGSYRTHAQMFKEERARLKEILSRIDSLQSSKPEGFELAVDIELKTLQPLLKKLLDRYRYWMLTTAALLEKDGVRFEYLYHLQAFRPDISMSIPLIRITGEGSHEFNVFAKALSKNKRGPVEIVIRPDIFFEGSAGMWDPRSPRRIFVDFETIASGQYEHSLTCAHEYFHFLIDEIAETDSRFTLWQLSLDPTKALLPLGDLPYGDGQSFSELATSNYEIVRGLAELHSALKEFRPDNLEISRLLQSLQNRVAIGMAVAERNEIAFDLVMRSLQTEPKQSYLNRGTTGLQVLTHVTSEVSQNKEVDFTLSMISRDAAPEQGSFDRYDFSDPRLGLHRHNFFVDLQGARTVSRTYRNYFSTLQQELSNINANQPVWLRSIRLEKIRQWISEGLNLESPVPIDSLGDFSEFVTPRLP